MLRLPSKKTEINTYDRLNQLIGFTDGETTASYTYDVNGLRLSKTVNGVKTTHIWIGNQIAVDYTGSYTSTVYLRETSLVAAFNWDEGYKGDYRFYTQNAHGDVVSLTDSTGAVVKSYTYDAFGVEKNIDDSDSNPFRYCGEYFDTETGTIYLRARYYSPTIGRFISRDSYAGKNEDPLSLNLYTYCHNNPIVYVDPSGHGVLKNAINKWCDFWESAGEAFYDETHLEVVSQKIVHSTPLNSQEDMWCWNASAQMFASSYGYNTHTQTEAAQHIFPNETNLNQGATMKQVKKVINFYSDGELKVTRKNVLSEEKLLKRLETRGPVIISRGWYDSNGVRNGGHNTIIYGYELNESSNTYEFYINDPWEPNIGKSYTRTYDELVDGRTSGIDEGKWEESIYAAWYN